MARGPLSRKVTQSVTTLADLAIKQKPHSHPDPKYSSLYSDVVITLTRVGTFPPPPAYFTFVFLADLDKAEHEEDHRHHPRHHRLRSPPPDRRRLVRAHLRPPSSPSTSPLPPSAAAPPSPPTRAPPADALAAAVQERRRLLPRVRVSLPPMSRSPALTPSNYFDRPFAVVAATLYVAATLHP